MELAHARARAHTSIYRSSNPGTLYAKAAVVPDETAEDWEPLTGDPNYSPPLPVEDCCCGDTTLIEDDTDDELDP
jgi:hypothetical protein